MLRLFLLLTMYFYGTTSYLASCTEDSQCPSKFYCEENAHYCRECVRCDEFKREEPQAAVSCVKTVLQCGPCLQSVLHGDDKLNTNCVNAGKEDYNAPHAYLPTYAWAVIIIALLLMLITLCVFLKTKTFKVTSYSSRTSLRAADVATACQPLAPPPYNYALPPLVPHMSSHVSAPEIQRLVESPQPCKKPSQTGPLERPREGSTSQAARMYNHPAYVRVPQNPARSSTPERSMLSPEISAVDSPAMEVASSPEAAISSKLNNTSFAPKNVPERDTNSFALSRIEQDKDQDSNNNRSSPEGSCSQGTPSGESPCRDAYIIGGPSFVINVVENINNLRQRNDTTYCRFDST